MFLGFFFEEGLSLWEDERAKGLGFLGFIRFRGLGFRCLVEESRDFASFCTLFLDQLFSKVLEYYSLRV